MKSISSVILLLMMYLIIPGCESEKENSLDQEIRNRSGKVPKTNLQNQNTQPQLKPLTNLTPEQKKIRMESLSQLSHYRPKPIDSILVESSFTNRCIVWEVVLK